ncbi:MAG TPA: dihydrofolate reductase [Chitinophagales bacterium]
MLISIVVAIAENNAIGKSGDLLWKLPNDMKRFKDVTMGHCVLMGRKTYESIPEKFRPLTGRTNIVVSRNSTPIQGVQVVKSIEDGIEFAKKQGETELMIVGGGEIYKQTFPIADKIYLTIVHRQFEADTHFPKIEINEWKNENRQYFRADEKHVYPYTFVDLLRNEK